MTNSNGWRDDHSFQNLELGAQCGNFGELYFPKCFLTEYDEFYFAQCDPCFLHFFCDAYDLSRWDEDRFLTIIMCNPFGYGFEADLDKTALLLLELSRVLKSNGEIFVLGHERNKYCTPSRVKKNIENFNSKQANIHLTLLREEEIDSKNAYPDYKFFKTGGQEETEPNRRMVIKVSKS
jgi:hypothetical protein